MIHPTRKPETAIQRAATLLPDHRVSRVAGEATYSHRIGDDLPLRRNKWRTLAALAVGLKYAGIDPSRVAYVGSFPTRSLSPWEEAALAWLTGTTTHQENES